MTCRLIACLMLLFVSLPLHAEWLLTSNTDPTAGCSTGLMLVYLNSSSEPKSRRRMPTFR